MASPPAPQNAAPERSSYRPIQLAAALLLGLVVTGLAISALLTWKEQERLELAQEQLQRMRVFETAYVELQLTFAAGLSERWPATAARWQGIRRSVQQLSQLGGYRDPDTPGKLELILALLKEPVLDPRYTLLSASRIMWEISEAENTAQERLLEEIHSDTVAQLRLEILAPLILAGFGVFVLLALRRQIFDPLYSIQRLLARLAEGDFSEAGDRDVPPLVEPVYANFNFLAKRLGVLEASHKEREKSLEREVRTAARALLEQQRNLARAERLAATGELAASLAHEIRNPLAGIQMALSNLRNDVASEDLKERIDQLLDEVLRLSQLLSQMLDSARHEPESVLRVDLAGLVDDLFSITRYQIPSEIALVADIAPGTACRAPEGALRQALLNLVLNAAAAQGDGPGRIEIRAVGEEEFTRIQVVDEGPGLPSEILEKGIRPFFSTRDRGTGLGLTLVQRVVRNAGGRIELKNRSPRGAEITLLLPSASDHD